MAQPVRRVVSPAAPLLADNLDTDVIIPSREMKTTGKTGLADGLFANRRYEREGEGRRPNPDFILNRPPFDRAQILLAGENFGCGSSREHAAWALHEWGIRAVVAPSFNPIFEGNCVRNGIAPVRLAPAEVAALAALAAGGEHEVTVDLERMDVSAGGAGPFAFCLSAEARAMLMEGLDPVALTLRDERAIAAWEDADALARPWARLQPAERSLDSSSR